MKKLITSFSLLLFIGGVYGCTTFFINKNGQLIFGRNYDWVTDAGLVCTNLCGLSKTSMKTQDGETVSWISTYGSITFNQYGKEFPMGGMNEKGLVVELMWLDETKYPEADIRPAVGVLQWIQYQLDNCISIEDVIATDKKIRIASVGTTPIHYLVADANGNAATIEFLEGKMVVHKEPLLKFPVLTNSAYEESVAAYKNGSYTRNNSLDRFAIACGKIEKLDKSPINQSLVDYAFEILNEVKQANTKWSIVYDIRNRSIHFKTDRFTEIKTLDVSAFDLSCTAISKCWNINQPANGNINSLLEAFTIPVNKKLVETAVRESRREIHVDIKQQESFWQYADGIKCFQ